MNKLLFQQSVAEAIHALFEYALNKQLPIAIWQSPDTKEIKVVVSFTAPQLQKVDLNGSISGFVVSPFVNPEGDLAYLLPADLFYSTVNNEFISYTNKTDQVAKIEQELYYANNTSKFIMGVKQQSASADNKEHYVELVTKGIQFLETHQVKKVVLSRNKQIQLANDFNIVGSFLGLCQRSSAFNSLVFLPEQGIWMGASPEVLIKIQNDIFHTMALAGTQLLLNENDVKKAVWTHKEIEEQALVSRYIIDCFKKIRLREYEDVGPKTVVAGNLLHLRTDFTVNLKEVNFPELGTVMLSLLHPTSAVCGMPKQEALSFILANEGYNREFFSGYLGPINFKGQSELYVNLRCAKIKEGIATLFAGAGITLESNPTKEYYETENKMSNMAQIFDNKLR